MINFKYKEVVNSSTARRLGIDNSIPETLMDNLMNSTVGIQKVREFLGVPMRINSWYRSGALNKAVGGVLNSAHIKCLAIDFVPVKMDITEAFEAIANSDIKFDQLILEHNSKGSVWIHISFDNRCRRQIFRLKKKD